MLDKLCLPTITKIIAGEVGVRQVFVSKVLKEFSNLVISRLSENQSVYIQHLGTFTVKRRKFPNANFISEELAKNGYLCIHFTPTGGWRRKLNKYNKSFGENPPCDTKFKKK